MGLLCVLFPFTATYAQTGASGAFNPYSQLGIGLPIPNPITPLSSIGGGYNAIRNDAYVNFYNPASYSAYNDVLFQFGFETQSITAQRNGASRKANLGYFNQIALGIPIIKERLGFSFGYVPNTNVGYTFSNSGRIIQDPDTVDVTYEYSGKGGTDKLFLGFGGSPVKGWSIGFNTQFYLGNIEKIKTSYFPSDFGSKNIQAVEVTRLADFGFDFGTQYAIDFKRYDKAQNKKVDRYRLTLGATYALGKSMNARQTSVARYFETLPDQFYNEDTTAQRQKVKLRFPHAFGAGISFGQPGVWLLNADFNSTLWSGFRYADGSPETMFGDSYRASFGGEVRPGGKNKKNIFNRITYRVGGHYGQSFLKPGGVAYSEAGVAIGLGIPILSNDFNVGNRRIESSINVGLEYGMMIPGSSLYTREQVIRFTLAFNLKAHWFQSFKFN